METFAPKGKIFGPILPQFILEKRITLGAKVMYALLCNYASEKDHCWPSHATLASRLSCSISSVKNYLAELVRENLIAIRKEHYRSSVYYLIRPEHNNNNADESNSERSERVFTCNKSSSGYINNFNKQKQEKNTPFPPKTTEETPQPTALSAPSAGCGISSEQDFENVWNLYPKKEAKGFARLAWFRLARCGQLPPVSELHAALQHCMAQESWHREQGRFIPQLGNWLRGQRWLDALSSGSPSGRRPDPGVQKAMQEREEQEKRILERQKAEKERLRPLFRAFAEKFDAPFNEAMAFGIWLHLHSIHSAPAAEDVPADNTRSIVAFLLEYRRKVQERRYTPTAAKVQTPISYFHRPELLFGRNSESPVIPTYAEGATVNQLISLGILALLSLPWDAQAETSAASRTPLSPATMATVHGQSADSASLPEESAQKTPAPSGSDLKKAQEAQALFEESLRQMMPLDKEHIQEYRKRSDQRERALLPVSPDLRTRTVRVTLEPGRAPVKVFTTANIATSLVFHDSTGQPWPITSVTNGGPSSFQVLRPELPEGNLLNVMPIQGYATSTLVVTLENRDIPLVIRLESDSVRAPERKADALVLIQLAHHGPKSAIPLTSTIKETASSAMLSFLDRVPPDDAVRLRSEPDSDAVMAWKYNGKHYVRTTHSLMWPAWTAVVNGAGSTKCYELPVTTRIMLSREGSVQTILLKNTLK